jgi:hypothetical protein
VRKHIETCAKHPLSRQLAEARRLGRVNANLRRLNKAQKECEMSGVAEITRLQQELAEARAEAEQMLDLLREYRSEHDADACSPNGDPETCGCSMCRKLDSILSRARRKT